MRTIAVLNQKGGVGKTTTAVNLGAALALRGKRVLLVDMDPQGNLTDHLVPEVVVPGAPPAPGSKPRASVYDVLVEGKPIPDVVIPTATPGLFVLPSHEDMAGAELDLASVIGREMLLRDALALLPKNAYDYILLDCPPSLGLLPLNALAAADEVFIVLQTEFFSMRGLGALDRTVDLVKKRINPRLRVSGILPTLVDPVTRLSREVIEEVSAHYRTLVFETRIRQNVRLAEAPGHAKHIFEYAPESPGAEDYAQLALEVEGVRPAAAAAVTAAGFLDVGAHGVRPGTSHRAPAPVAPPPPKAAAAPPKGAPPPPPPKVAPPPPKPAAPVAKAPPPKPPPPPAKPPPPPGRVMPPRVGGKFVKRSAVPLPAPPPVAQPAKAAVPPKPPTAAPPPKAAAPIARGAAVGAALGPPSLPPVKPAIPRAPKAAAPPPSPSPAAKPHPPTNGAAHAAPTYAAPAAPQPIRRPAVPMPVLRARPVVPPANPATVRGPSGG